LFIEISFMSFRFEKGATDARSLISAETIAGEAAGIMDLDGFLRKRKKDLVQKWFHAVVETYSSDASRFFENRKDPFANPVGNTFRKGLDALYDRLLDTQSNDPHQIGTCLDPMIRIRAVQNFFPSQAVGFLFDFKKILRQELGEKLQQPGMGEAFTRLEERIDEFGLIAFNIYMQCREKIYQLKTDDLRERTFRAFERAGLVYEISKTDTDQENYH